MKLNKLTLTNVRAFSHVEFDFQPSMNLIVGINGAGKSTILDSLCILLSYALPLFTNSNERPIAFKDNDIASGQEELVASLNLIKSNVPITYELKKTFGQRKRSQIKPDNPFILKPLRYDAPSFAVYYSTRRSQPIHRRSIQSAFQNAPEHSIEDPRIAFRGSLRHRTLNVQYFAEWWLAQEALGKERWDKNFAHRLNMLDQAVTSFLTNCSELHAIEMPKPTLQIKKDGKMLDIALLSDGERSLIALVLDLARRLVIANPDLENPLKDGEAVVFIDELDLHLHPSWQRTIVQRLTETFPNCQFIATSHSPFIIQSLQAGQLINLDSSDDSEEYVDKSIEDISEEVMGIHMPQKSERYLQMMEVAEQYYQTLAKVQNSNEDELIEIKQELDELSIPFSDDPAFTAFLKFQRGYTLKEEQNETD